MKSALIIGIIFLTFSCKLKKQIEHEKLSKEELKDTSCMFRDVDFNKCIGMTVGEVVNMPQLGGYVDIWMSCSKPFVLSDIGVYYGRDFSIKLHIDEFKHVQPYSKNYSWDTSLVYKERISNISLIRNDNEYKCSGE